ncbi:MAG: cell division protein SepF [Clostridia bacterium]|nr:cell division protein SepF [Clostridia bacterium]
MGIFDLFGKETKTDRISGRTEQQTPFQADMQKKGPVSVFSPTSYKDVEIIIDCLKVNKTAIVHLTQLKTETAIRILDMLSGAVYALNGGVYEMEKNIFMFSPSGVEVY